MISKSVFRLIEFVVKAAHNAGKWVGMCGAMAGNKDYTPLLLGLGLDEFSMGAGNLLGVRDVIRSVTWKEVTDLLENVRHIAEADRIRDTLIAFQSLIK